MGTPFVSVLLPVRNGAATLDTAVKSVLAESALPLELVAVDDGSTDGTGEVLRRLAEHDARVRVVRGEGRGISRALNLGLRLCQGRYVARMDADDVSVPGRLAQSVSRLERDSALWGVGTQVAIFREGQPVSPAMQRLNRWLNGMTEPERVRAERFIESPLCHPSVTLRAERLHALGGWTEADWPEDYDLWLRILSAGGELCALPEVLLHWRDGDERLTRTDERYALSRMAALKARHLAKDVLRGGRCSVWGAGRTGLRLARKLREEGVEVVELFDFHPGKLGQRIDGAPVVHPDAVRAPGEVHLISAVGSHGARAEIRTFLESRGYVEGEHFSCAA